MKKENKYIEEEVEVGLNPEDFEREVKVKIRKDAFRAKLLHCSCGAKMKKTFIDLDIPNTDLTIHLEAFRCNKCKKEYLNGEQAKKLDRAVAIGNALSENGLSYERAGNFDGYNIFVRFPAQVLTVQGKVKAEIRPISTTDFFVHFKKAK